MAVGWMEHKRCDVEERKETGMGPVGEKRQRLEWQKEKAGLIVEDGL